MFTTNMHKVCVITDSVPDETKIGSDLQIGMGYMTSPEKSAICVCVAQDLKLPRLPKL